jgi:hypothetical protein
MKEKDGGEQQLHDTRDEAECREKEEIELYREMRRDSEGRREMMRERSNSKQWKHTVISNRHHTTVSGRAR